MALRRGRLPSTIGDLRPTFPVLARFDSIWEVLPEPRLLGMAVRDECPESCGICAERRGSYAASARCSAVTCWSPRTPRERHSRYRASGSLCLTAQSPPAQRRMWRPSRTAYVDAEASDKREEEGEEAEGEPFFLVVGSRDSAGARRLAVAAREWPASAPTARGRAVALASTCILKQ